jgi:CBS domain-containing protein
VDTVRSILESKGAVVWGLTPDATVYDAIAMMADKHVGALMVLEDGKLVGIISERDYARKVILKGRSSKDTKVREIMTPGPFTVEPPHTALDCMRIMTSHRIRHLPVCENNRVVGMISIGDLVNSIINAQAETIKHLRSYVTGEYPR